MRPGHFCPGNLFGLEGDGVDVEASMRPGHFCPGNATAQRERGRAQDRFNEAGAFLPRKRIHGVHDLRLGSGLQ